MVNNNRNKRNKKETVPFLKQVKQVSGRSEAAVGKEEVVNVLYIVVIVGGCTFYHLTEVQVYSGRLLHTSGGLDALSEGFCVTILPFRIYSR